MNEIERYEFWHLEMRDLKIVFEREKDEISEHVCKYCGHEEKQINNHLSHIEIFHSEKPLN